MSSKAEDKLYEDIEKVMDDVKEEFRYVMHINNDPEKMVRFLGVSLRHAAKEIEKVKNKYEL
tara:strand:+ start:276 stop:461 length:186 start_codon:yes stop_codon:yes gene_type:complete